MTVAELMTELAKWPPDLEVYTWTYDQSWNPWPKEIDDVGRITEGVVIG